MNNNGKFVISLDFELYWGVRDKRTIDNYGKEIIAVYQVIPRLLSEFSRFNIKGTFATVGLLFAKDKNELLHYIPSEKPLYTDNNLSPYLYLDNFPIDKDLNKYHFCPDLIDLIQQTPGQEIATHTFSHYYCLEDGQVANHFREDLMLALEIAKQKAIEIKSIVFPRNQVKADYLQIVKELGLYSYRGNETKWFYQASNGEDNSLLKRALRLLDTYINLSGHNCSDIVEISKVQPYNIPSSRFLRPYSKKLKLLENLRLKRIIKSMTYAAKHNKVFHLWWHPHNFGANQEENFSFLEKILKHYSELNIKYNFESITMRALAEEILN
ncbi:MAG: polysaccharide deacetylase family protein [Chitinophagales bacterium]|nr:polysaccharide deacetylase family protein [Chitinophagales bacterium]